MWLLTVVSDHHRHNRLETNVNRTKYEWNNVNWIKSKVLLINSKNVKAIVEIGDEATLEASLEARIWTESLSRYFKANTRSIEIHYLSKYFKYASAWLNKQ